MTPKQGLELLKPFIKQAEKDKDPYFLVHLSSVFPAKTVCSCYAEALTEPKIVIIIKLLMNEYGITNDMLFNLLCNKEVTDFVEEAEKEYKKDLEKMFKS